MLELDLLRLGFGLVGLIRWNFQMCVLDLLSIDFSNRFEHNCFYNTTVYSINAFGDFT